jgi:hypothetical protein
VVAKYRLRYVMARGSGLCTSELEYVTAAQTLGNAEQAIMPSHIPNMCPPPLFLSSLGVQPPDPEWDNAENGARLCAHRLED